MVSPFFAHKYTITLYIPSLNNFFTSSLISYYNTRRIYQMVMNVVCDTSLIEVYFWLLSIFPLYSMGRNLVKYTWCAFRKNKFLKKVIKLEYTITQTNYGIIDYNYGLRCLKFLNTSQV